MLKTPEHILFGKRFYNANDRNLDFCIKGIFLETICSGRTNFAPADSLYKLVIHKHKWSNFNDLKIEQILNRLTTRIETEFRAQIKNNYDIYIWKIMHLNVSENYYLLDRTIVNLIDR